MPAFIVMNASLTARVNTAAYYQRSKWCTVLMLALPAALIAKPVSFEQACLKGMKGACGDGHLGLRGILCLVGIVLLGLSRETSPQP